MQVNTITEQMLFATVRIETQTPAGVGAGTAFIFSFQEREKQYLFLVTNKHVVKDATIGRFFFTLGDGQAPKIGQRFDVEMNDFENRWFGHPDTDIDVAVMPLVPVLKEIEKLGKTVFFRAITDNLIPTPEQINELDAIEEVVFIGYPNGIFDSKNLMPVVRRGTTATHLQIDYEGKPVFLIDASVFPGSSGSPVLIANTGGYAVRNGFAVGNRVFFLGIISSVAIREEQGQIVFISSPVSQVPIVRTQQMIDLGIVYKASTILETVKALRNLWSKPEQAKAV
jgi:V8-like Glu-specific endopeptidase